MADDVTLTAGTIAADEISSVKYQRVKNSLGPDGTATDAVSIADVTTAATNARETGIMASGVGPGYTRRHSDTVTALNDAATFDAGGVSSIFIEITGTWVATLIFEYSIDNGSTWVTAGAVMNVVAGQDTWVGAAGTTAANGRFRHHFVGGMTKFRVRASAFTSGTATVVMNGHFAPSGIKAIEIGPAPHNIGFALTNKVAQYTTTQTGTAFWTPASGKRLVVTQYQIQVGGTTAGNFQLWYGGSADTTYTRGTDRAIYEGDVVPSASYKPAVVSPSSAWPAAAADDVLRVTTSAGITITFNVWGYEY
jgi:hypothetical protein